MSIGAKLPYRSKSTSEYPIKTSCVWFFPIDSLRSKRVVSRLLTTPVYIRNVSQHNRDIRHLPRYTTIQIYNKYHNNTKHRHKGKVPLIVYTCTKDPHPLSGVWLTKTSWVWLKLIQRGGTLWAQNNHSIS